MWIRFDFRRDANTQIRLHKIFRPKISEWTKSKLIDGQVLTYHFDSNRKPQDSLYLCLSIPSIKPPRSRSELIKQETIDQIPKEIYNEIEGINKENSANPQIDTLQKFDFEVQLSPEMYGNAPKAEILNFATKGTGVALEILDDHKTRRRVWKNDKEIIEAVHTLIVERLGSERERHYGLHFACNSIFLAKIVESYLRNILNRSIDGDSRYALDFLYDIEETGDIRNAVKQLELLPRLL